MKAKIEFEMPKTCCYCPCCTDDMRCQILGRDTAGNLKRPGWCPIKTEDLEEDGELCTEMWAKSG